MLKQRILTAVILVTLVGVLLFEGTAFQWEVFIWVVAAIAAWEWAGFAQIKSAVRFVYAALTLLSVVFIQLPFSIVFFVILLQLVSILVVVFNFQKKQGARGIDAKGLILAAGILNIWLFAVAFIDLRNQYSIELLLLSLVVIWAMDTGAYFSGRAFGKRKLAVYVSPGKTWEGVYGGFLLAFAVAYFGLEYLNLALKYDLIWVATLLTLIGFLSVLGDLFESVLKRQAGLKDSGVILPGHGGVLDRIDSLIVALPLFVLCWHGVLA